MDSAVGCLVAPLVSSVLACVSQPGDLFARITAIPLQNQVNAKGLTVPSVIIDDCQATIDDCRVWSSSLLVTIDNINGVTAGVNARKMGWIMSYGAIFRAADQGRRRALETLTANQFPAKRHDVAYAVDISCRQLNRQQQENCRHRPA
jgi:hypothetical protein